MRWAFKVDELRERIAQALWEFDLSIGWALPENWDEVSKDAYIIQAECIITALGLEEQLDEWSGVVSRRFVTLWENVEKPKQEWQVIQINPLSVRDRLGVWDDE